MMEEAKPPVPQCGSPNTVLDPEAFFQEQRVAAKAQAAHLYQLDATLCSPLPLPAGGQAPRQLYPGGAVKLPAPMAARVVPQHSSIASHGGVVTSHRGGQVQTRSYQTREQSQQSSCLPEEEAGPGGTTIGPDGLKRGPWTKEEDLMLAEYVQRFGPKDWSSVPMKTGLVNRCGKSCRLRYVNHLRPNLKKEAFSEEEEQTVIHLQAQLGNKWAAIAAQMPGRTDNEIKNLWNTRIKKRKRDADMHGLELRPPMHAYRWPHPARPAFSDGDCSMPPLISMEEWGGRVGRGGRRMVIGPNSNVRRSVSVPPDAASYVYMTEGTISPAASSTTCPPGTRPPSANSYRSRLSNSTRASCVEGDANDTKSVSWSPMEEAQAMLCCPTPGNEHTLLCPHPEDDFMLPPPDHPVESPDDDQHFVLPKPEVLPAMPDQMINDFEPSSPPLPEDKMFQRKAFIEKLRLDAGGGVHWAAALEMSGPLEGPGTARGDHPGSDTPAWTPSSGSVPSFLRASTPGKTRDSCRTPGFPNPFTPGTSFFFAPLCETPILGGASSFDVFPSPAGYQKTVKSVTDEMMAEDDVAWLSRSSF